MNGSKVKTQRLWHSLHALSDLLWSSLDHAAVTVEDCSRCQIQAAFHTVDTLFEDLEWCGQSHLLREAGDFRSSHISILAKSGNSITYKELKLCAWGYPLTWSMHCWVASCVQYLEHASKLLCRHNAILVQIVASLLSIHSLYRLILTPINTQFMRLFLPFICRLPALLVGCEPLSYIQRLLAFPAWFHASICLPRLHANLYILTIWFIIAGFSQCLYSLLCCLYSLMLFSVSFECVLAAIHALVSDGLIIYMTNAPAALCSSSCRARQPRRPQQSLLIIQVMARCASQSSNQTA